MSCITDCVGSFIGDWNICSKFNFGKFRRGKKFEVCKKLSLRVRQSASTGSATSGTKQSLKSQLVTGLLRRSFLVSCNDREGNGGTFETSSQIEFGIEENILFDWEAG